ncbi:hypothetical protein [Marinicrinis sediminis]|uniref:Uncharacterized protein n=1 Tax=Marinicrinis sediminis TaxID=1652465 RepID=A0ABW5R7M0_9BACL
MAAEVYFLPISMEKEYAFGFDLPFDLGGTAVIYSTYEGAPNAQEWMNMLTGKGW